MADLSSNYISQIETGKKQVGRIGLLRIIKALDTSIVFILERQFEVYSKIS